MILYHGTSTKHLPSIFRHGLRGRGKDGATNWTHTIESNPDTVYLTDAYPAYFALQATDDRLGDKPAIIKLHTGLIDPACGFLVPDEDALEQGTRNLDPNDPKVPEGWLMPPAEMTDMYERTRWYRDRADQLADYWPGSLNLMGTCGFKGTIWPSAFEEVAILTDPGPLALVASDAQISALNYRFCAEHHKNLTRIIFGDLDDLEPTVHGMDPNNTDDPFARYRELIARCKVQVMRADEAEEIYLMEAADA